MFGVFNDYELQVIHDWIRGEASADGARFDAQTDGDGRPAPTATFRAQQRLRERRTAAESARAAPRAVQARGMAGLGDASHIDIDMDMDLDMAMPDLVDALAPGRHWTPEGLRATRQVVAGTRGA